MTKPVKDDDGSPLNLGVLPLGVNQIVAVVAASARTAAGVGTTTRLVRVAVSTLCYMAIGDGTVAATTAGIMLVPNYPEYFVILPGQYIAFIRDAADGKASVTEVI